MQEAIKAARQVCGLPLVASMTFTRDDRTVLGDEPKAVARALQAAGADVIGVNCSGGPAQLLRILRSMRQAVPGGRFWVKPNAGWPEQVGGRIMYPADPDYFAEYAISFRDAGAGIVGGCCGTTPPHIAAMRRALDSRPSEGAPAVAGACRRRSCGGAGRGSDWISRASSRTVNLRSRSKWILHAASRRTSCWRAPRCWLRPEPM